MAWIRCARAVVLVVTGVEVLRTWGTSGLPNPSRVVRPRPASPDQLLASALPRQPGDTTVLPDGAASALLPLVALPTAAAIIASRAHSAPRRRGRRSLGYAPRLDIQHTSSDVMPGLRAVVNWFLAICTVLITVGFRSSSAPPRHGIAVTGMMVITRSCPVGRDRAPKRLSPLSSCRDRLPRRRSVARREPVKVLQGAGFL